MTTLTIGARTISSVKPITHNNMGYTRVCWPDSQLLMGLTDEDMDELGIELGDDCSYFVPDENYDEAFELAEKRAFG